MPVKSKQRLTRTFIDRLAAPDPSGKQTLYWDSELTGFGVLVSGTTNSKTYIVQRVVAGNTRRVTVERANLIAVEDARTRAMELLSAMGRGIDPKQAQRIERQQSLTLREAMENFFTSRAKLKASTKRVYRYTTELYLSAWLDKPLSAIDADMIEERHKAIAPEIEKRTKKAGTSTANRAMRVFRTIYNHVLVKNPSLPDNPARRLSLGRAWFRDKRRTGVVKRSDLPAFYKAIQQLTNAEQRDYLLLVLFTGFRRTLAEELRWDREVDLKEQVWRCGCRGIGTQVGEPQTQTAHVRA